MSEYDVVVIGSGLSGLSCAFELVEKNKQVLILEKEAYIGGRTASWVEDGMEIESGLHRWLGFYSLLPELLKRAGIDIDDTVIWEDEIEIVMPDNGPRAVFGASILREPLETIAGVVGNTQFLSPEDKASFLKFVSAGLKDYYTDPDSLDSMTVTEYAKKLEISKPVVERVLSAFTEGILFWPVERFSMLVLMSFLGPYAHKAIRFGVGAFKGGMSEVMADPLAAAIIDRGGELKVNSPVDKLLVDNKRVIGVIANSKEYRANTVVVATSVKPAQRILTKAFPDHPWINKFQKLPTISTISIQFDLKEPTLPVDRTTFSPGTVLSSYAEQSRTTFSQRPGRLSAIIPRGDEYIELTDDQLLKKVLTDGRRVGLDLLPLITDYRVVRHKDEFYEPSPGTNQYRPSQKTPIPALVLAGDYTEQPNPSTMEGAVGSGKRAAELILGRN